MVHFLYFKENFLSVQQNWQKPFYYELNFPESVEIDNIEDLNL